MSEGEMFDLMREALFAALVVSTPMLGAALALGLLVGLLQALTSVQELTLTFVPKIAAMAAVMWLSMDMMGRVIVELYTDRIIPLVAGG